MCDQVHLPLAPAFGGKVVMALSLWEPWATLMALGVKTIETRHWPTRYRGPLLICAAQRRKLSELDTVLAEPAFQRALRIGSSPGERQAAIAGLHFGHAVALVHLGGCWRTKALRDLGMIGSDEPFGDFSPGRYGWMTSSLRRLDPFPATGRQGLFRVRLPADLREWRGAEGEATP